MSTTDRYYPTEDDRAMFHQLVATVRRDPARFRQAGADLDAYYSPEARRQRSRAQYDALVRDGSITNAVRREALGPFVEPSVSLAARFQAARDDSFFSTLNKPVALCYHYEKEPDDKRFQTALFLLGRSDQMVVATRRVLLGWLILDAGRGEVIPRVSEFQDLETVFTEDGLTPISMPRDPALRVKRDKQIFLAEDGSWPSYDADWIRLAQESLEFLEAQPDWAEQDQSEALERKRSKDKQSYPAMYPGPDFMTFHWGSETFDFQRPMQRAAIKHLWEAWEAGHPRMQVERLRELVGSRDTAKPSDWFRGHPAWGRLVVTLSQGIYALKQPDTPR